MPARLIALVLLTMFVGGRVTRCDDCGVTYLAFRDGRYDKPFSHTHHAICHDRAVRIEIDEG